VTRRPAAGPGADKEEQHQQGRYHPSEGGSFVFICCDGKYMGSHADLYSIGLSCIIVPH